LAAAELPQAGTAQDLALWWGKWVMSAGHKNLFRLVRNAFGIQTLGSAEIYEVVV
jgi:hypothetical protein